MSEKNRNTDLVQRRCDLRRIRATSPIRSFAGYEFGSSWFWTTLSIIYRHGMREAWATALPLCPPPLLRPFPPLSGRTPNGSDTLTSMDYFSVRRIICVCHTDAFELKSYAWTPTHVHVTGLHALRRRDYVLLLRIAWPCLWPCLRTFGCIRDVDKSVQLINHIEACLIKSRYKNNITAGILSTCLEKYSALFLVKNFIFAFY